MKLISLTFSTAQLEVLLNLLVAFDKPIVRFFMPWSKDVPALRIEIANRIAQAYTTLEVIKETEQ
jgi:hypothetical protein